MNVRRGEIWYANLNPVQGSEQAGTRPVLVFQNNSVSRVAPTVLAIPFTTNLKRAALPSCIQVNKGEGGLPADSVLLYHQLRVLDGTRLSTKLGIVSSQTLVDVEACVLFTLGIS